MDAPIDKYRKDFQDYKCCVVIPTYNNAGTLQQVIEGVSQYSDHILVINDGSNDATRSIIEKFKDIHVVHHPVNKGKGVALQTAFKEARRLGYENVITIDSDGQHQPGDIPKFLEKMKAEPGSIIIGSRNMDQSTVPGKSSFGHKFSNFWFWFETGIQVPDTQSGYRLYPLLPLEGMKWFTWKYEFEIEVIVRAVWKGVQITSVPVSVYYAPKETRISHFRPFQDFSRVSVLNVFLVTFAIIYYRPLLLIRSLKKKNFKQIVNEHLLNPEESEWKKISSIMFGVFMGIFPVWGYQLLIGISLAHLMKLNKFLFVIAAHISIPPMIPVIVFASYYTGAMILGKQNQSLEFSRHFSLEHLGENMIQYVLGSIVFSIVAAAAAGIVAWILFRVFPLSRKQALLINL